MKIAILGWGSLIWEKSTLPLKTPWIDDGPKLPIEFCRISSRRLNALTLVINQVYGENVSSKYAISKRTDLADAICDLRDREETLIKRIGYVNLIEGDQRCNIYPEAANVIRSWASIVDFDSVIWTDLPTNYFEKTKEHFSIEHGVNYLHNLPQNGAIEARKYINNAPPEALTPLRRALIDDPWLSMTMVASDIKNGNKKHEILKNITE